MKILDWLNEKPEPLFTATKDQQETPQFKHMVLEQLCVPTAANDQEALNRLRIARKIHSGSFELEDADFSLLVSICRENKLKWLSHFHAQVLERLEATKAKE